MKKKRFISVAAYIIIPVFILGFLSVVSAYISLAGLSSVNNISEKIYLEQLENITVLDKINVRNERIQKLMLKLFLSGNKETMEQVWSDVESVISEASSLGVTSAAASIDSLVGDINDVNMEIETNKEISNTFKEETNCFVNL